MPAAWRSAHVSVMVLVEVPSPLLAKGAVASAYGAYRAGEGTSERALFVIDGAGTIRWSYLSPVGINPGADGILGALEELSRSIPPTQQEHRHDDARPTHGTRPAHPARR